MAYVDMQHLLLLVICLGPLAVCAKKLVMDPPEPTIRVTRPFALSCHVAGVRWNQDVKVEWLDPDGEVIDSHDRRLYHSLYVVIFMESWRDDVKETGNYTCRATIGGKTVEKSTWIYFSDVPAVGIYPIDSNNSVSRIQGTGKLALTCKATGLSASDTKIEWLDTNNETIGHALKPGRIYTKQFPLRTRLQFDDVKIEDHGQYTCRVINGGKTTLKYVHLNVYGVVVRPPPNSLKLIRNTGLALHCYVTEPSGGSDVTIEWLSSKDVSPYDPKNAHRIFAQETSLGSTLYIDDLADEGGKPQTCRVRIDGNTVERDIYLPLYDTPESVIVPAQDSMRRMKGATASMYCKTKGLSDEELQDAKFEWLDKNDNIIGPYIRNDPRHNRVYTLTLPDASRLQLDQLTSGDQGTYTCRCTVGGNIMINDIQLIIYGKADTPTNLQAATVDSRSIIITWDKGFNDDTKQRFYIEYRQPDGQWITHPSMPREDHALQLKLDGLKPATMYDIRLNAANKYGSSNYTYVRVTTLTGEDLL
ncbi:protogenin-like [Haliotis cracherodii]|uniref:protogenin-like n=1 Tax=Haliotis cracherodii TaxID=6455 RepID=UPI0039E8C6C8